MANQLRITQVAGKAMMDALTTACGTLGILRIYDGSQPADADTAVSTQNILAEVTMGNPAFPAATSTKGVSAVLTANAITQDAAVNNSGTASWFRLFKSDGTTAVMDGSVGTAGCDLNMASVALVKDGTCQITSMTLTLPIQ